MPDRPPLDPFVERTVEEERRYRKQRLALGFRLFSQLGLNQVAGHIAVRDPENADHLWVNPFGMCFGQIRVRDLVLVDGEGNQLAGSWSANSSAIAIHTRVHAARPDVIASVHAHSTHGKAFSTLDRPLRPLTQDACTFFEDLGVYSDYGGFADDAHEAKQIAVAIGGNKAAILGNHGLITVGQSVDEAAYWFVMLERCCQDELLALAAGEPRVIPDDVARQVHAQVGTPLAGWYLAQYLFGWIEAKEPDCLEE